MPHKRRLFTLFVVLALSACSRSLSPGEAQGLVRDYLAPFKVEKLEFKSIARTQVPAAGDAYIVVANFVVPYNGKLLNPMPNQTFFITYNELTHRYEINQQLTGVAQGIQGMIGIHRMADTMKARPYNPSPWNKR